MTKPRSDTGKQRHPSFTGLVIVDTWRGVQRVRAWPRKRGTPTSEQVRDQNAWFKAANQLVMRAEPSQIKASIAATANVGLYPRDVLVRAMGAGLLDIVTPEGQVITYRQHFWEHKVFQGTIIRPASDIVPAVGTWFTIPWPLPLIDTAGFWDVAAPTRLTVPAHIDIIQVSGGVKQASTGGPLLALTIRQNGAVDVAWSQATSSGTVGDTFSTGPIPVIQGDYFECLIFATRAGNLSAGPLWYGVEILETS